MDPITHTKEAFNSPFCKGEKKLLAETERKKTVEEFFHCSNHSSPSSQRGMKMRISSSLFFSPFMEHGASDSCSYHPMYVDIKHRI